MKSIYVILAFASLLFIAVIVVLADQGRLPAFVTGLYGFPYGDKVGHFALMGGLSLLVNLALPARLARRHLLAILLVTVLVAMEEASQAWFGTRHADLTDLAASLTGILCLGGLGWRLRQGMDRREGITHIE